MKKILTLLLSTTLLLCVVIGLSACGVRYPKMVDAIDEPFVEYYYTDYDGEDILYERLPINEGDTFVEIPGPELPGYEFKGWIWHQYQYVDGDALPKSGGMRVYAWFDSLPYTVTFISQGTVIYENEYWGPFKIYDFDHGQDGMNIFYWKGDVERWLEEKNATSLEEDYFVMNGFFLDEECTQPLEKGYVFTEDTNVYIDWYHLPIMVNVDGDGAAEISIGDMYGYRACGNLPHTITLPTTDEQGNVYLRIAPSFRQSTFRMLRPSVKTRSTVAPLLSL